MDHAAPIDEVALIEGENAPLARAALVNELSWATVQMRAGEPNTGGPRQSGATIISITQASASSDSGTVIAIPEITRPQSALLVYWKHKLYDA